MHQCYFSFIGLNYSKANIQCVSFADKILLDTIWRPRNHLSVETLRYISFETKGNINKGQSNFVYPRNGWTDITTRNNSIDNNKAFVQTCPGL